MDSLLNSISHDPYLFNVKHFKFSAWLGHAPFMKFIFREFKPKVFVELGTHNGFSYFVGCQSIVECGLDCKAFAVDHWIGDAQAGFFDEDIYSEVIATNQEYSGFSTLLRMSFSDALPLFENHSVDLLHIDGFHSYESVSEDFNTWLEKMSDNGIVLLHDIHVRRNTCGVYKFWAEIKEKYRTIEFVGSHGLGVVFLGKVPDGILTELFEISNAGGLPQIQGTFGSITNDVMHELLLRAPSEISNVLAERDIAIHERDLARSERDARVLEIKMIQDSRIWRSTNLVRKLRILFRKQN